MQKGEAQDEVLCHLNRATKHFLAQITRSSQLLQEKSSEDCHRTVEVGTVSDKAVRVPRNRYFLMKRRNTSLQPAVSSLKTLRRNAILNGLSDADLTMLATQGRLVFLETRRVVYNSNEVIKDVFFPIDGVLSVVTFMRDGGSIEVGTIGREGVSAIPLLLGGTTSANECYCQVPGDSFVVEAKRFQELASRETGFRVRLDRFLQAYVNMLGQLAACNGMHNIYERTARWLLMTHDRVDSNEIRLTHEFLSMMLGARRSGVTIAAATLQQAGFISYARGHIVIVNRRGLEEAACECYEVARLQFSALLPPSNDKLADGKRSRPRDAGPR